MSLFGSSWEDPKTAAIMGLAGGLLQGNAGAGLQQGLLGYQRQSQINNQTARQQKYDAREDEEFGIRKQQMQAQSDAAKAKAFDEQRVRELLPKLAAGEIDAPTAIAAGVPDALVKAIKESGNYGRQKVARTVKGMGPDGREYEYQVDDYGQRVGEGMAQFKAPLMQNLNDKVVALDPYTLKPQAQFAVGMSPGERAADARGWASNKLARDRLDFDRTTATEKRAAPVLPASALKMQQESLDRIGIANSVNADLAAVEQQIAGGKLKFGPISNIANAGLNMAGLSTEESRNFASFKSTLERLRNESLRLNTGVQTDGDAQRAWNELFQNINDTGLVQQRLKEIQGINKRGAELQRLRADSVRANYGLPPIDASSYEAQPPALAAPGAMGSGSFGATPTMRWNPQTRKLEPVGGR